MVSKVFFDFINMKLLDVSEKYSCRRCIFSLFLMFDLLCHISSRVYVFCVMHFSQSAADMWTACVGQLTELHQESLKQALEAES